MKVLTTEQIRRADEFTIAHEPVPSLDLMERAALGLASFIEAQSWNYRRVRIFAGYGNNGGDGIALARLLGEQGKPVSLDMVTPEKDWSPDAKANILRLPEIENLVVTRLGEDSMLPVIREDELVIDALFGSGLTREPAGLMARLIDHINQCRTRIISVDIPSGLFGEDNRANTKAHVIRATLTLTFEFPKLCFFLPENQDFIGEWRVIPIGLHTGFTAQEATSWNFTDYPDIRSWLRVRKKFSHKGNFGHALLVAGSTGKTGAAVLSASACIRSGAGLTTVLTTAGGNPILQGSVPEAMTVFGGEGDCWSEGPDLTPYTAIGAGPGIGTADKTWKSFGKLLATVSSPLVLDADALNLLSQNPGSLLQVPKNSILTPHPGEFKRLFGEDPDDYSRIMRLKSLAEFYGLVLVLKGANTAVAGPDGSVWFNVTGNPGMATGGSGDVLTGLITGLAAQGYDTFTAARLGVFIHGLAGDIAAEHTGEEALTAGDIIRSIGPAFLRIHNYPS
jgi:NAD(P)H-hydrate epimerase